MNLLKHDKKYGAGEVGGEVPTRISHAIVYGGTIVVSDPRNANHITTQGEYGHYLIDRREKFSRRILPEESTQAIKRLKESSGKWREKNLVNDHLYLSPWETVFLSIDLNVLRVHENKRPLTPDELWTRMKDLGGPTFLKKYALYRYLRKQGWCVRSGLTYGCDYLIYRGSPGSYHAAAGVKIESHVDPFIFVGFNRALTNNKKAFIIATALVPEGLDTTKHDCVNSVEILMSTSATMFVERKMNDIKAKELGMERRGLKRKVE